MRPLVNLLNVQTQYGLIGVRGRTLQ